MTDELQTRDTRAGEPREKNQSLASQALELLVMVALAFVLAQVVRTFLIQPYVIPTGSMIPTIQISDQVLADKLSYRFEQPKQGQIVVLDDPTGETPLLIKRVIAVGGQTIDLQNGKVVVDGKALEEPYTYGQPSYPLQGSDIRFPLKLPADTVWVMGDNRTRSKDSRWFGPQPMKDVRGRAFVVYWPPARWGALK